MTPSSATRVRLVLGEQERVDGHEGHGEALSGAKGAEVLCLEAQAVATDGPACRGPRLPGTGEHGAIVVHAHHPMAGQGERDGQAATADPELKDASARLMGQPEVDLGIVRDVPHIEVVEPCEGLRPGRLREASPPSRWHGSACSELRRSVHVVRSYGTSRTVIGACAGSEPLEGSPTQAEGGLDEHCADHEEQHHRQVDDVDGAQDDEDARHEPGQAAAPTGRRQ